MTYIRKTRDVLEHPADKFINPLVSAYHMPLSAAERTILRTIWDESARQAKLECVAICNGFDTCHPDYIADAILLSIQENQEA
jgi:hypothetical protein